MSNMLNKSKLNMDPINELILLRSPLKLTMLHTNALRVSQTNFKTEVRNRTKTNWNVVVDDESNPKEKYNAKPKPL